MRWPARRSVRLRTIGCRVRSRRCVCSCTHATREMRRRCYSASARTTGWLFSSSSASTSASSSAMAAPWAMFGELACAASPTSTTRPAAQGRRRDLFDLREVRVAAVLEQARHRIGEVGEQVPPVRPSSIGRIARADVGVAVSGAVAEGDREEGAVSAEHDCPLADLGEVLRDEPPSHLSDVAGRHVPEGEAADARVDTVRTDHEVVRAGRPVGEAHVAGVVDSCHRKAEPRGPLRCRCGATS